MAHSCPSTRSKRSELRRRSTVFALGLLICALAPPTIAAGAPKSEPTTAYPGGFWEPPAPEYGYQLLPEIHTVAMDDGIVLVVDVTYPTDLRTGQRAEGPFPVLLTQTPYNQAVNRPSSADAQYFAARGYIFVSADVRGSGRSGGLLALGETGFDWFGPRDRRDGVNLVNWVAHDLDGSNGVVGLQGCSALGISQINTAIGLGQRYGTSHPVKAMIPNCADGTGYRDTLFDNGIPSAIVPLFQFIGPVLVSPKAAPFFSRFSNEAMTAGPMAYAGSTPGATGQFANFWVNRDLRTLATNVVRAGIPLLMSSGWNEGPSIGQLEMMTILQNTYFKRAPYAPMKTTDEATGRYQVVIGRGDHGCCLGDLGIQLQWYEHWLKGVDTGLGDNTRTPFHLQELGSVPENDRWVNVASYPMVDRDTRYFLGAGALSRTAPTTLGTDVISWAPAGTGLGGLQSLTYRTPVFVNGATLAGPIALTLYAASSNTNLQIYGELADVAPDGAATVISHGSLLGSLSALDKDRTWRDDTGVVTRPYQKFDKDRYLLPGVTNRFEVNLQPIMQAIEPGHSLELRIRSQAAAETCNAGIGARPIGCALTVAQATSLPGGVYMIERSAVRPSSLNLPLLPYRYFAAVRSGTTPTSGSQVLPLDWGNRHRRPGQ